MMRSHRGQQFREQFFPECSCHTDSTGKMTGFRPRTTALRGGARLGVKRFLPKRLPTAVAELGSVKICADELNSHEFSYFQESWTRPARPAGSNNGSVKTRKFRGS